MKNKILIFVIGVLVGAIIATIGFYIYQINNKPNNMNNFQMRNLENMGTRHDMKNSNKGNFLQVPNGENMEEPPESFDGNNIETPPGKHESDNVLDASDNEQQNNNTSSSKKTKNKTSNVS